MSGTPLLSSIRLRLWLAASLPALFVIVALLVGFADRQTQELSRMLAERGRATAQQVASAAEFALFASDVQTLQRLARNILASDPDIVGVAVIPADGRFVVEAGELPTELPRAVSGVTTLWSEQLAVIAPVTLSSLDSIDLFVEAQPQTPQASSQAPEGQALVGMVVVAFDLASLQERQRALVHWSLALTVLALFLAGFLSIAIAASVTGPMAAISRVVERIGKGALHARADVEDAGPLKGLARGINDMAERIAAAQEGLQQQVALATEELRQQKEAAEKVARIDALTGVASRRAFTERAELEIHRALRYRQPLSVVMVDLDRFKRVNDTYGHAVGDAVLVAFAQAIMAQIREVDMLGRLGGEEFAVMLPGIGAEEAMKVAERMRGAVQSTELMVGGQPLAFTASFGVAEFDGMELNIAGLLARADAALYQAKRAGRNRVVFADDNTPLFQDSQIP